MKKHTIMFFDPNGMRSVECASRQILDERVAAEIASGKWELGIISDSERQRVVPLSPTPGAMRQAGLKGDKSEWGGPGNAARSGEKK